MFNNNEGRIERHPRGRGGGMKQGNENSKRTEEDAGYRADGSVPLTVIKNKSLQLRLRQTATHSTLV